MYHPRQKGLSEVHAKEIAKNFIFKKKVMHVKKSKMIGMNCEVTIQDKELEVKFSVELGGKEPIVMIVQDPEADLKPIDILNEEELLIMQDIALNEANQLAANG